MDRISIIIPVYNVEPYIRKCLDSVINQTYQALEILLINDGSPDNCRKICVEYSDKDSRIKVFHKENGGLSSARNVGLRNCTGDYIGFVDSDDWIEPDMYEVLLGALKENNVCICAGNFTRDTDNTSVIDTDRGSRKIPDRLLTQEEMLLFVFRNVYYAGFGRIVWNKLFDANFIKTNNLFFDEDVKVAEDVKFMSEAILADSCTGFFTYKPLYHYYQRGNSLINSKATVNKIEQIKTLKKVAKSVDKKGFSDTTIWLKREHCYNASLIAEKAIEIGNNELLLQMRDEMRIYLKEYLDTNAEHPDRLERVNKLFGKRHV